MLTLPKCIHQLLLQGKWPEEHPIKVTLVDPLEEVIDQPLKGR